MSQTKGLCSSGMLQSNDSQLETDVLGETVGPIVKQSQEDTALPATA